MINPILILMVVAVFVAGLLIGYAWPDCECEDDVSFTTSYRR